MGERPSSSIPPPLHVRVCSIQLLVESDQSKFDRGICHAPRRRCVEMFVHNPLGTPSAPEDAKVLASLSFSCGGLGLASAFRVRRAAHFASWADSLQMVRKRHPHIAATMVRKLEAGATRTFEVVRECKIEWWKVEVGLEVPSWCDLSFPRAVELVELEPNKPKFGWQQQVSRVLEKKFVSDYFHVWTMLRGLREVTTFAPRVSCIHSSPIVPGHKDRPTAFPFFFCVGGCTYPLPLVSRHLPMWPPIRQVWPPSRSMFRGRGVEEGRLSSGARSGTGAGKVGLV